jgi:hypothetical protein
VTQVSPHLPPPQWEQQVLVLLGGELLGPYGLTIAVGEAGGQQDPEEQERGKAKVGRLAHNELRGLRSTAYGQRGETEVRHCI